MFFILILIFGLTGCGINNKSLIVKGFEHPQGAYLPEEKLSASATIFNRTKDEKEVWVEFKIKDRLGELIYSNIENVQIISEKEIKYSMSWTVPEDVESGSYKTELAVWDNPLENPEAVKIASSVDKGWFLCFHNQENFDGLDKSIWDVSDKHLGRSNFKSRNVSVNDGKLKINMPANTFDGGEIFTKELQKFGAFEIRMKLPLAPTSITGFFLYTAPDYFFEVDIELHNESDGTLLLTTYSDGKKNNEYVGKVSFDPTNEFHNYRIEYYEDSVKFYIDNKFIKGWSEGFPKGDMNLMLNSWYPNWLAGEITEEDKSLLVDWIRY